MNTHGIEYKPDTSSSEARRDGVGLGDGGWRGVGEMEQR